MIKIRDILKESEDRIEDLNDLRYKMHMSTGNLLKLLRKAAEEEDGENFDMRYKRAVNNLKKDLTYYNHLK